MRLRGWQRRLEHAAREEFFEIPQPDGTVARFPRSEGMDALLALIDGRDHPLAQAARNSPDPKWFQSFFSALPMGEVEDLSE